MKRSSFLPPEKSSYKELVVTKITSFHEKEMRIKASTNDLMKYMNVSLSGLRGRHHPCLSNIVTTDEVKKLRPHIKFLTGDYLTYERKFEESNQGNPICRICKIESESISHILATCSEYSVTREKILQEIQELCLLSRNSLNFEEIKNNPKSLTQFILDPTSFNLVTRIHNSDPIVPALFKLSRDICFSIHNARMKKLRELLNKS